MGLQERCFSLGGHHENPSTRLDSRWGRYGFCRYGSKLGQQLRPSDSNRTVQTYPQIDVVSELPGNRLGTAEKLVCTADIEEGLVQRNWFDMRGDGVKDFVDLS